MLAHNKWFGLQYLLVYPAPGTQVPVIRSQVLPMPKVCARIWYCIF